MKTLFIIAEQQEAKYLIKHYGMTKSVCGKNGPKGLCSIDIWRDQLYENYLIVTGPGVNNVIETLSKAMYIGILTAFTNVVNVGYAGAKGISVGTVSCVKVSYCLEFPVQAETGIENGIEISNEGCCCYTSFDFVEKADDIFGKALFDMELAYIARFVHNNLYAVKIVSDNLDYGGFKEFNGEEAWKKAIKMIEERGKANVSRYVAT